VDHPSRHFIQASRERTNTRSWRASQGSGVRFCWSQASRTLRTFIVIADLGLSLDVGVDQMDAICLVKQCRCDQEEEIPGRFGRGMDHLFISLPHLDLLA
jgi:hypothetical protein